MSPQVVLVKMVKKKMFFYPSQIFFKKRNFFLSEFILLPEIATLSCNAIPRRRIFFILQCFFKIFHKSIILVQLAEEKPEYEKSSSHILICKRESQPQISLHVLLQGTPLKITRYLKQHLKNALNACLHALNKGTNKQT